MKRDIFYIAVCDDEKLDRDITAALTDEICRNEGIQVKISCFESTKALLEAIQRGETFDAILMDVMMPEQDGMDFARHLRRENMDIAIVFISSNREMALHGYEVAAARYLAKPLEKEDLREALLFLFSQKRRNDDLLIPVNGARRKVSPLDIYYIEIMGRKTRVVMADEVWVTNISLDEWEKMLTEQDFIRCHKSFLVNCRHIRIFGTSSVELSNGENIPVSKHRIKGVREAFMTYIKH